MPRIKAKERQPTKRKNATQDRRWGLLLLLTGQPRQRVSYRAFLRRAVEASPSKGLSARQCRDQVRHDVAHLARLGVVRLTKGKGQFQGIILSERGLLRWLWSFYFKNLLRAVQKERTEGVRKIAQALAVAESTVWRWLTSGTMPRAFNFAALRRLRAFELSDRPGDALRLYRPLAIAGCRITADVHKYLLQVVVSASNVGGGELPYMTEVKRAGRLMAERGMTEAERRRAGAYLNKHLWERFYLAPEGWHGEKERAEFERLEKLFDTEEARQNRIESWQQIRAMGFAVPEDIP